MSFRCPTYAPQSQHFLLWRHLKDRQRCFGIHPSRLQKTYLRMARGMWLQDRIHSYTHTHAPRILLTLSWLYQIRETRCPSPHCNANEKECADKRPDPKDERAEEGQRQQMLKGESLLRRWEVVEESVLVVVGDHSLAPPQQRLIQGFCRSFSSALLGGVIPVGLQRASLFIWGWPSRQVAGALWSCQGEGTSFPGEGTPVPLTFTGAFCWEASQAQVKMGTILTWDSTQHDPVASCREVRGKTPSCNNWKLLPALNKNCYLMSSSLL